ncbi:MAG: 3-deoxy-7-phosphoheptulonate synthase [Candidatus Hydrogenedentota bacterium]
MIVVLKPDATPNDMEYIIEKIKEWGFEVHISKGKERTIIGIIGDERLIKEKPLNIFRGVEQVLPILKPYKLVSREFQHEGTKIKIGDVMIGGNEIVIMAGPCSVESEEQVLEIAKEVKEAGAKVFRGGAFKPRTSPYSFQGLGIEGLKILDVVRKEIGLIIVTEIMDVRDVETFIEYADIIQVGARNMQNFNLLKELGTIDKPVLLKRGMASTLEELFMSAEYIAKGGNKNIILCERGIRTFNTYLRNTPDLSAIPIIHKETHLPCVFDPSHSLGTWEFVEPMSMAAVACGVDGLLIEVHNCPEEALCDGSQSLKPRRFKRLIENLKKIALCMERKI